MKYKDVILLLVLILLLVIAWVVFSIYHNLVTSTTPEALEKEALIISPDFDEKTINKLKERKRVLPVYDLEKKVDVSPTIPIASEGGKIVP